MADGAPDKGPAAARRARCHLPGRAPLTAQPPHAGMRSLHSYATDHTYRCGRHLAVPLRSHHAACPDAAYTLSDSILAGNAAPELPLQVLLTLCSVLTFIPFPFTPLPMKVVMWALLLAAPSSVKDETLTSEVDHVSLQAKLVVRVVPLAALGGVKDTLQQQLRLSVTCMPTTKRSPVAPSLRQDAVSYGGTYGSFGRWDN